MMKININVIILISSSVFACFQFFILVFYFLAYEALWAIFCILKVLYK